MTTTIGILLLIITLLMMLAGLAGTVLPMIPGILLIYAGYAVYGLATGWRDYGWGVMAFWGVITLLMQLLDYYAGALGAKKFGASGKGIWGSIIGGFAGLIIFNVLGLVIGTFLGAAIGELLGGRTAGEAARSGWGAFLGFVAGSLFKLTMAIIMIGVFLWLIIF